MLDADGGTQIIAMLPERVHIEHGLETIACLSLSDRGLLRWYADCCKTPIANTPRSPKMAYAGVVHSCLATRDPSPDASFGPSRIALNTKSATGDVAATPMRTLLSMLQIARAMTGARLRGAAGNNPFFDATTGEPIRQPRVLDAAERARFTPGGG